MDVRDQIGNKFANLKSLELKACSIIDCCEIRHAGFESTVRITNPY
jgi:hypothetical protein